LFVASCRNHGLDSGNVVHRAEGDVVGLQAGDPGIAKAKATAQAKLDYFISQLGKGGSTVECLVKFDLKTGAESEHIWAMVVDYDAARGFDCKLANVPLDGSKYKMGDAVTVQRNQVEDWIIRRSDTEWEGGFSEETVKRAEGQQ
jgi:uncharacterized protein YegJ (DUF2314 family)